MRRLVSLLLVCVCLLPLLAACNEGGTGDTVTLYVYNWGEYISDGSEGSLDVNAAFEEWYEQTYGVRVEINYSTFSSNEDMYTKISSGATKYDVIFPSDYMLARMIDEGMLRKLNFDNIPNVQYIDNDLLFGGEAPYYDKEAAYSVPYTYGTIGIIYNQTMVEEEDLGSWDIMWNEKYKGNILQFNNSRDALATALYYLGYSVNTENEAEWREALALLKTQKEIVQGYVMDEIYNKMENGSAAIAPYYAGDFFTMYADNEDLAFFYPQEGTNIFVDAMCIPTGSQNPEIAEAYINFMLSEEAAVANAEYICYASPNKLVTQNEDYVATMEELHPDAMEILYGTADIPTEAYENLPESQLTMINELWEDLKIESTIGGTIIGLAVGIVALLAGMGIFFAIRRRKRRRIVAGLWND
ncbi:MAG: spermidine/putrescine ABC transporter substrate-binding protein [Clostridia bacterium]|nr:spermidine/putrescine ABC transporter substrate-binding protein [Clostridia bacterium]